MNKKHIIAILLVLLSFAPAAMAEGWTWTSSDEAVIRVWPDGGFVVAGVGTATLTGSSPDSEAVTITVTVPDDFADAVSEAPYIGNMNTHKFHDYDCASVNDINESNKISFSSREEAIDEGYKPCGRCDP